MSLKSIIEDLINKATNDEDYRMLISLRKEQYENGFISKDYYNDVIEEIKYLEQQQTEIS